MIFGFIFKYRIFGFRLEQEKSPVVFCHNDMQEGNILLNMDHEKENTPEESQLMIIGRLISVESQFNFMKLTNKLN